MSVSTVPEVIVNSLYDAEGNLVLRPGDTVSRGDERGSVTHIVNWHWADVWWVRHDGTTTCERTYLPNVQCLGYVAEVAA